MNTWMNNPQYLAQVGHFLGGCLAIVLTAFFGQSIVLCGYVLTVGLVAAAIKEFWYDANYELPKQSWKDNLMDFGFYSFGGLVGFGLAALKLLVLV